MSAVNTNFLHNFNTILLFGDKMKIYETHRLEDARLPFIFHDHVVRSNKRGSSYNWHENLEIIYAVSGNGIAICDGKRIEIKQGDILVVNSNSLHGFSAGDSELKYYCLIIDRHFFLENHFDSNDYIFNGAITDEEISHLIDSFAIEWKKEDSRLRVQKLRSLALDIAVMLCDRHGEYDNSCREDSRITSAVKQAIGYVRAESEKDISLDEISSFVGISKYYFSREFHRVTGYSFVEYLNRVRCDNARKLLLDDTMSVGEICKACGFKNLSYFTRTFTAYEGLTPRDYRKKNYAP